MDGLLKKLNFKEGLLIYIENAPVDFDPIVKEWESRGLLTKDPKAAGFFLGFVQSEKEVMNIFDSLKPYIQNDEIFWMAYPKGSSKKYQSGINRDRGWDVLGKNGFEGVRQVAIDEDWSALRFRKIDFIKSLTRKNRLTDKDQ